VIFPAVPLGEVATVERDGIDPTSIQSGSRYVGLEHIDSSGAVQQQIVQNGDLASTKFVFGPDHILFGKLRPYLRKIARPEFDGVCSTDIIPIRPGPNVDRGYLFHFLRLDDVVN
jgi:type I restriction enzyme S subunit